MTAADLHPDTGVPRPGTCCGVCPPIAGGGWDCTCPGMPGCSVNAPAAEWDDLARLAEAATPGPWDWRDEQYPGQLVHRVEVGGWPVHPMNVLKCKDDWLPSPADAEFIAAANPATILRLIEALDSEGTLAMVHRDLASLYREERDALAARLAAVEALADEWERAPIRHTYYLRECAADLRAALAAPTDTTKEN